LKTVFLFSLLIALLSGCAVKKELVNYYDAARNRNIPVALYLPHRNTNDSSVNLVLLSHGYGQNKGGDYKAYSYLTHTLAANGYWVASIQHELPTDSLIPLTGVPQVVRRPFWDRGADNIYFVLQQLKKNYPAKKFRTVNLIGHSNGGDMTALFPQKYPGTVDKIITLDNRRMPLPRTARPKVYSLRSSDQPADEGVVPDSAAQKKYGITIIKLPNTIHNNMDDHANKLQRAEINSYLLQFLTDQTKQIDQYLSNTNRRNKFNGTALVVRNNEVLLYKGYGFKDFDKKSLNDTSTIYMIGSISKTFTSAIILKLAAENKLALTDNIAKYIPGYPEGDKINIKHLLTHTAGVFDYLQSTSYGKLNFEQPISIDSLISYFKDEKLLHSPGEKFSYSNSHYTLLAKIIENITGKKVEDLVIAQILIPLQMTSSGFDFRHLTDSNKATNYNDIFARNPVTNKVFDSTHATGSGNMYAAAMDLFKWHTALNVGKIIDPVILKDAYTVYKGRYGYGWFIDTLYDNPVRFHGGGVPGFAAHFQRFAKDNICIILLSNSQYCDLHAMSNHIAAILFNRKYVRPRL
jgi:CubicO group peptidase (beta-lactamase class C family)/predicted esterase